MELARSSARKRAWSAQRGRACESPKEKAGSPTRGNPAWMDFRPSPSGLALRGGCLQPRPSDPLESVLAHARGAIDEIPQMTKCDFCPTPPLDHLEPSPPVFDQCLRAGMTVGGGVDYFFNFWGKRECIRAWGREGMRFTTWFFLPAPPPFPNSVSVRPGRTLAALPAARSMHMGAGVLRSKVTLPA
jgi:hypothetical protein